MSDEKNTVLELMTQLGFDEHKMARYLAVPVSTLRKWVRNDRKPSASVLRLVEVLDTVRVLSSSLHSCLVPPDKPPAKGKQSKA